MICFICYKLEDHTSANCPTEDTIYIVCSERTGNHYFKDCTSTTKNTLTARDPIAPWRCHALKKKKDIIKLKRIIAKEKEQEKQDQTYARVAAKTIEEIGLQTKRAENTQTAIDRLRLTSIIMMMDAHIHNIIEQGSYSKRVNKTLSKNGIEPIELATPDSEKLTHQTIGETIKVMSERREKLERLEKIG